MEDQVQNPTKSGVDAQEWSSPVFPLSSVVAELHAAQSAAEPEVSNDMPSLNARKMLPCYFVAMGGLCAALPIFTWSSVSFIFMKQNWFIVLKRIL